MIKVLNVNRSFGKIKALTDISFEIDSNQVIGLLGPNGAGKTTLMRLITGCLEFDSGTIEIGGKDIAVDALEIKKIIGYLPENNPLYPDMTVIGYLNFCYDIKDLIKTNKFKQIEKVVNLTNLEQVLNQKIYTLSKGFKQRVGLAQALLADPKILILDEPTNGLDPSQINDIRNLIKELSKNTTIILSTHIMQEVEANCSRVLMLKSGKLINDFFLESVNEYTNIILESDIKLKGLTNILTKLKLNCNVESLEDQNKFKITIEAKQLSSTKNISKKIIESGFSLDSIYPEKVNLENLFLRS